MISSIVPSESGLDSYWTSMMICPPLVTCPNLEELNLGSHYYHEESLPAIDASISDEVQYHMYDLFDMLRQASLHTPPPERVLTKLTTLRLHFKPIGILKHRWEPGPELLHVFLSPTLRDISLHRCSLENVSTSLDDIQCAAFNKSTPLESLRLQDSWISVHVLRRILALPCRLKTFFLNDECRMGPTIFSSVDDWTEMLSQQKDSLEEIVILGTAKWNHFNGPLDLRGMARLRLLAGWIFNADEDKIKRLPHVKTMRPSQYEGMLERTRPEWAFWISDDEVVAAEQGHSEWFHHDDIYSDVDDMDMDDYDENGAWIFEI
ncbi:hypothetical protein SLS58_008439 [Diplodia intermedia]|uniref:F-box domain-containing protein n=1 Tax=Diplodia intermedia TaxID=856260 RepID=A0ABR3THT3_9PEZI